MSESLDVARHVQDIECGESGGRHRFHIPHPTFHFRRGSYVVLNAWISRWRAEALTRRWSLALDRSEKARSMDWAVAETWRMASWMALASFVCTCTAWVVWRLSSMIWVMAWLMTRVPLACSSVAFRSCRATSRTRSVSSLRYWVLAAWSRVALVIPSIISKMPCMARLAD